MKHLLWTDYELKLAIQSYLEMLELEKNKKPFVKADFRRDLQKRLTLRSKGSIERRWRNISSVFHSNNQRYLKGYKPLEHVGTDVSKRIWQIVNKMKDEGEKLLT